MLISTGGTVIRIAVEGIRRMGRSTQGVIVMRLRGDERVSTLAPVVESSEEAAEVDAAAAEAAPDATQDGGPPEPVES